MTSDGKIRKYLVFTGMFLLFLGCMWLIFAPSEKDRQEAERKTGFNAELPDPRGTGIEADKMAAYEQADMVRRQEEKKRTLADFSALADGHRQENVPETETAQKSMTVMARNTDFPVFIWTPSSFLFFSG